MTNLKKERIARKLTLQQLAKFLGVTHQYVSLLENGKRKPSFDVSIALKEFFNIPAEDLLAVSEEKKAG